MAIPGTALALCQQPALDTVQRTILANIEVRLSTAAPGPHLRDGKPAGLAGFLMPAYLDLYEATGDPAHLDRFVGLADWVLSTRDDRTGATDWRGRSAPQWSTTGYNPSRLPMSYLIDDGGLVAPMARFAALVRRDACLPKERAEHYRERANAYVTAARQTLDFHAAETWREAVLGGRKIGYFVTHCGAYFVLREQPCMPVPLNYSAMAGLAYVHLIAAGDDTAREMAERLVGFVLSEMIKHESGAYTWYYWPQLRWEPGKGFVNADASVWSYRSIEDLSHSTVIVDFLTTAAAAGVGPVKLDDLKGLARTFNDLVHAHRPVRLFIDGTGAPAGRYSYLHGRIAALTPVHSSLWNDVCSVLWNELELGDSTKPNPEAQRALALASLARLMRYAPMRSAQPRECPG